MNDHGKSRHDAAGPDERTPGLIGRLEAVDRRITPEHVAQRFRELLDDIGDNGPPVASSSTLRDDVSASQPDTAQGRPVKAAQSAAALRGTSDGGTLLAGHRESSQNSPGATFGANRVFGNSEMAHLTGAESTETGYRRATAVAAAGITPRQLDYWARTGLVEPSVRAAHGSGSQRLYSFRDVLVLKIVKRLLDTGIALQQIRAAIQHLRDRSDMDLAQVTLMSDGVSVYECTSPDEIVDLLAGGQGAYGVALGRVWQEVAGDLAALPYVEAENSPVAVKPMSSASSAGQGDLAERHLRRSG